MVMVFPKKGGGLDRCGTNTATVQTVSRGAGENVQVVGSRLGGPVLVMVVYRVSAHGSTAAAYPSIATTSGTIFTTMPA